MKNIVEVKNFQMKFGKKTVIKDLSFDVKAGEIFGLLGSNGSGKTTTLRALLGFYTPTSGELLIDGRKYRTFQHGRRSHQNYFKPSRRAQI